MTNYDSFSASHIGQSHIAAGTDCQDFSSHYDEEKYALAVVADGHGSAAFVRSGRGSRFASHAAAAAIKRLMENLSEEHLQSQDDWIEAMDLLCRNILLRWYELVEADCKDGPFTEEEVENVPEKYRQSYLDGEETRHAYGTTLLAAVVTENCFFALRNGDGECVILNQDGSFSKPIPWNERCESSTTTSLCGANALEDFRFYFSEEKPLAVFLGSDGVDDSYTNDEELFSLYRELCITGIRKGMDAVNEAVRDFLPVLTARGSRDDVSIAGIMDCEAMRPLEEALAKESQTLRDQQRAKDTARQLKRLMMRRELLQKEIDRKRSDWMEEYSQLEEQLRTLDGEISALTPAEPPLASQEESPRAEQEEPPCTQWEETPCTEQEEAPCMDQDEPPYDDLPELLAFPWESGFASEDAEDGFVTYSVEDDSIVKHEKRGGVQPALRALFSGASEADKHPPFRHNKK